MKMLKIFRFFGYFFLGLALTCFFLLAFLPTILSTSGGKTLLFSIINPLTGLNIDASHIHLSWFNGQQIEKLTVEDYKNGHYIDCAKLKTEASLWKLLLNKRNLGLVEIQQLNAYLSTPQQKLELLDVDLKANLGNKNIPLSLETHGKTIQNNLKGYFDINFSIPNSLISKWNRSDKSIEKIIGAEGTQAISFIGTVDNFPVAILEQLTGKPLQGIVGEFFNLKLLKNNDPVKVEFGMQLNSPKLKGEIQGQLDNQQLSLQKPAIFNWNVPEQNTQIRVEIPTVYIPINDLSDSKMEFNVAFPIPESLAKLGKRAQANFIATIPSFDDIKIKGRLASENYLIDPIEIKIIGDLFKASLSLPENPILGSAATLQIQFDRYDSLNFSAKLKSSLVDFKLFGDLKNQFLEIEPVHLKYTLTNDLLKYYGSFLHLDKNAQVHLSIDPFKWNLKSMLWSELLVKGEITIPELVLDETFDTRPVFNEISIPWVINGSINQIRVIPSATFTLNNQMTPAQLSAQLTLHDWLQENHIALNNAKFETFTNLFTFPTAILNRYLSEHNLIPLLGSIVDVQLITLIDPNAKSSGYFDMDINTQNFHSTVRLQIDRTMISALPENIAQEFKFTLTPEGFSALKKIFPNQIKPSLELKNSLLIAGSIDALSVPFDRYSEGKFQMQLHTNELEIRDLDSSSTLEPIRLNIKCNSAQIGKKILCDANFSSKNNPNLANLNASIENFNQLIATISCKELSTNWIESFIIIPKEHQHYLKGVLGEKFNLAGNTSMSDNRGVFNLSVDSDRSHIHLSSQVNNGKITLLKPLTCELRYSPELVSQKNSLLNNIIRAEQPLTLTIDSKDFSLNFPFDVQTLKLSSGTLNLGKIWVKNEGEIKRITSLIKPIQSPQFMLWFTPIYFSIDKGNLHLSRFDLLVADQYPMAGWGDIQLRPFNLNAVIGIGGQALTYAFGVQGVGNDFLLKIPIYGNQDKITVDYPKATAKIGALVAQLQANPHLKLVGTILEILGGDFDSKPPKPTTQPFPWDDGKSSENQEKKRAKSAEEKVIENIEEGASLILNQIFKKKNKK